MNDLAIITTSAMQGFMQLREANRLKYPKAYFEPEKGSGISFFDLGSYLTAYCMDVEEWDGDYMPEWMLSFVDLPCALTPEVEWKHYIGFFGLPRQVKEGILIYIHERFYDPSVDLYDFAQIYQDFWMAAADIIKEKSLRVDIDLSKFKNEEELDGAIDDSIESWVAQFDSSCSYFGGDLPYFNSDEEVTLFCQLLAYMGHEIYLYPAPFSEMEYAPADVLLNGMAAWEELKDVKMSFGDNEFGQTDTVIAINPTQNTLNGNTYLAEYMEKIFNQSPWRHWLKDVMEDFREFFPLREEKIRINAYAQIEAK